ncbi:MAG: heparan-alpha-glucosaminide N-acetyltransferase domain-containing protein [Silvibacterium sp.]
MRSQTSSSSRLSAIDALRGAVMIFMALDHIRDFFHAEAILFSPTDLSRTTVLLFFTRWITHFCLPVFMFLAGTGAFLRGRKYTKAQLSQFLWTRGLWFLVLEITAMRLAYNFNFSTQFMFFLLILWVFGVCMIVMAALIHLPIRWLAVLSVAVIAFHNLLDGIPASQFGSHTWIWNFLHQPGVFSLAGIRILIAYPLLPWVAVMAAGYCFGEVFLLVPERRQKIMVRLGLALTIAFVVIRAVNRYGDPAPWSHQKSGVFTLLSFLNCTKYPGSLDFLLMTIGPALLVLAWFDRCTWKNSNPLIVFGRVPFFYFVLHFYLMHGLAAVMALLRYGTRAFAFIFNPVPTMGGPADLYPANFGYHLWVVYAVWIGMVAALYPCCKWYMGVKARRHNWWLSYL